MTAGYEPRAPASVSTARGRVAAALLAGALLPSSFDLHSVAHGSPAAVLREPAPIFASAAHAEQRAHLEAAGNATYPRCPACVLRIQALGCPAARSDSTRAAAHGAAILLVRGLPPSAPVPLLAAPRGPPLL